MSNHRRTWRNKPAERRESEGSTEHCLPLTTSTNSPLLPEPQVYRCDEANQLMCQHSNLIEYTTACHNFSLSPNIVAQPLTFVIHREVYGLNINRDADNFVWGSSNISNFFFFFQTAFWIITETSRLHHPFKYSQFIIRFHPVISRCVLGITDNSVVRLDANHIIRLKPCATVVLIYKFVSFYPASLFGKGPTFRDYYVSHHQGPT